MSNQHTPGPWYVVPDQPSHGACLALCGPGTEVIARSPESPEYQHPEQAIDAANFARIVKCVNAHDDLLEALQDLLAEVDAMTKRVGWAGHGGRDKAREAIAKATQS